MKFSLTFCLSIFLIAITVHSQEFNEPGWFQTSARTNAPLEAIEPGGIPQAAGDLRQEDLDTNGVAIAEAITPEIASLARGLENDPKRIFDYVHDHIRYVHYFGSKKGAQLTLLERSGNDFDQCALLVALLRAAGHTASYQFGMTYLPYEQTNHQDYRHWIGTTKPNTNWEDTVAFAFALSQTRGFPYFNRFQGNTNLMVFQRVWVSLAFAGTNYLLDPAFKVSEPISGINLGTAMGLNTNQLITAAGGTSTSTYAQSLNETALGNKLRDYTTNLLFYLENNFPNASVDEILGGRRIVSSADQPLSRPLPCVNFTTVVPNQNWNFIPTNLMTTVSDLRQSRRLEIA